MYILKSIYNYYGNNMETAKIFYSWNSQAIRIPQKFRLKGKEAYIKKMGEAIIILPQKENWDDFFENLKMFSDDFMVERIQPEYDNRKIEF